MVAYLGLEEARRESAVAAAAAAPNNVQEYTPPLPQMSCRLIERVVSLYKRPHRSHRNILDQEKKFLDDEMKEKRFVTNVVKWLRSSAPVESMRNNIV